MRVNNPQGAYVCLGLGETDKPANQDTQVGKELCTKGVRLNRFGGWQFIYPHIPFLLCGCEAGYTGSRTRQPGVHRLRLTFRAVASAKRNGSYFFCFGSTSCSSIQASRSHLRNRSSLPARKNAGPLPLRFHVRRAACEMPMYSLACRKLSEFDSIYHLSVGAPHAGVEHLRHSKMCSYLLSLSTIARVVGSGTMSAKIRRTFSLGRHVVNCGKESE